MAQPPRRILCLAGCLLLLLASPASAAKKKLALEDLTADPPLAGRGVTEIAWLPDSRRFSYLVKKGTGEEAILDLIVEEAQTGKKTTVASEASLKPPAEAKTSGAPAAEKKAEAAEKISLKG